MKTDVDTSGAAIWLEDVCCNLGDTLTLSIDALHIARGERVAIIGANGAGKSSLLRVVSGFIRPLRGKVTVLGCPLAVSGSELRRLRSRIGQVLQGLF